MPRRKEAPRSKRFNDRIIPELKDLIRQGLPWNIENKFRSCTGLNELRGLVTGHFFFTQLCEERGDKETKKQLYDAIRDELVLAHAHYRPGLRPWAWWQWDAPELRHVIGRDLDEDDEADCFDDCLPAAQDRSPNLPEWAEGKIYFGKPSVYDGYVYEDEYSYLQRLDLLFAEEKAIFKKYESIINVYVQQGERGKCVPCWERAREIAKKIDFDVDTAMQPHEFWIPDDLYIACEHWQNSGNDGIFVDAD